MKNLKNYLNNFGYSYLKENSMEFSDILKAVKNSLKKEFKITIKDEYSETIPFSITESLLKEDNIPIFKEYIPELISPWGIAKYIFLYLENKEIVEKIKEDLNNLIPDSVDYNIHRDFFSCKVDLYKKNEYTDKQQWLTIKYFINEDDQICYAIVSNRWSWDISKKQLKNLLNNEGIISEDLSKYNLTPKLSVFKKVVKHIKRWFK